MAVIEFLVFVSLEIVEKENSRLQKLVQGGK